MNNSKLKIRGRIYYQYIFSTYYCHENDMLLKKSCNSVCKILESAINIVCM